MKDKRKEISRLERMIVGSMVGVFVLDALLPRGLVEWVFYGIPLFLTILSARKNLPYVVAGCSSLLIAMGFFLSRPGIPAAFSLADRSLGVVFLIISAILIERHRRLEGALQRSHETTHALLRRLERTREEERTRLARDVHDDLGQSLTALKMDLRWIERKLVMMERTPELDVVKARTTDAIAVVDDTTVIVQELAAQLRPSVLDRMGLGPAILAEVRRFQARVEIVCKTSITTSLPVLVPSVATALFRILQECLTNVARHAGASRVAVRLGMRGNDVILRVLDNGAGISAAALGNRESLGLLGIKERAAAFGGDVLFHRGRRRGTLVTVRIPNREP
jgi:two-component system sensor histidine kinase UhpB